MHIILRTVGSPPSALKCPSTWNCVRERRGEMADYLRLRREVSHHLRDRPMPDRDNLRLQNELGWQDDRGNLLRFLDGAGIEPTNNRADS